MLQVLELVLQQPWLLVPATSSSNSNGSLFQLWGKRRKLFCGSAVSCVDKLAAPFAWICPSWSRKSTRATCHAPRARRLHWPAGPARSKRRMNPAGKFANRKHIHNFPLFCWARSDSRILTALTRRTRLRLNSKLKFVAILRILRQPKLSLSESEWVEVRWVNERMYRYYLKHVLARLVGGGTGCL